MKQMNGFVRNKFSDWSRFGF